MRKTLILAVLGLSLGACQLFTSITPTTAPSTPHADTMTATPQPTLPTITEMPPATPTVSAPVLSVDELLATLPFPAGPQPNGSFVVREIQQADLTGDRQDDVIVTTGWKENEADEFAVQLQVDILSATGDVLYTQNTWEVLGESPSLRSLEESPLPWYDRIEAVDVVSLTGDPLPQVVVRIRYSGTGSILEAHILSFKGGVTVTLDDIIAYKGWMEYQDKGYLVSYPLYLFGEPNCCPCRRETATYAWDGAAFAVVDTLREGIEDMEGCPPFPTPAEWRALNAAGIVPPARRDAVLVYDPWREQLILFGGRDGTNALNDTWAFDLTTSTWTEIVPPGAQRPSPRHSMVAGIDTENDRMVIVAGTGEVSSGLNEVWTLDLTTHTWQPHAVSGATPAERFGAAGGIADYGQTLLLSHGFNGEVGFDDTWALDLETFSWRDVSPAGARPAARGWHSAAPISWTQLVVFGGYPDPNGGALSLGDTWILNMPEGVWRPLTAQGPAARAFAGMVVLGDRGTMMLFGGKDAANVELNDVWILDPTQDSWRQVIPRNVGPTPRHGHSMASVGYSSLVPGSAVAIFGGLSGNVVRNDLWLFVPWDE